MRDLDPAQKVLLAHRRLCQAYDAPFPFFSDKDPLSELVSALLSHRTRNAQSKQAYRALKDRFPDWAAVRDAPAAEVQAAIAPCTWPEQKAPRIQAVLRGITERRGGELSLEFLAGMPEPEAEAWLQALPGVGPKTSAAVLLFSRLRRPALPVDSHHHRVAQRLGLIGREVAVGPAQARLRALLPPDWDAQTLYDHHEALMVHGQRRCFYSRPRCGGCPVADLCLYVALDGGRAQAAADAQAASEPPREQIRR